MSYPRESGASNPRVGEVSIILATRARPQMLAEFFNSLRATTARKDLVSLWLYVDDDDATTLQAVEKSLLPDPEVPVHWHVGPQTGGLGETHQALWKASGRASQVYVTAVDDARFDTPAWDDVVRKAYNEYPDGVLLAFPHDPMTADQATLPIFGWGWLNVLGSVYPGYFPYWFDDKWVDDVGRMAGRCIKLPVSLRPIGGKGRTKRMRNMPFWTRFFHLTLHERKEAARKLIAAIYPDNDTKRAAALGELEKVAAKLEKEKESFSDVYCVFQEERHTELTVADRERFDSKYFKQETLAVARLITRARELTGKKQYAEAMDLLEAVQLSDMKVRQAHALMVECLRGLGRITDADRIAGELVTAWPQMSSLRRLFRFLGMVANDGKRMLVGLTHKGKKGG